MEVALDDDAAAGRYRGAGEREQHRVGRPSDPPGGLDVRSAEDVHERLLDRVLGHERQPEGGGEGDRQRRLARAGRPADEDDERPRHAQRWRNWRNRRGVRWTRWPSFEMMLIEPSGSRIAAETPSRSGIPCCRAAVSISSTVTLSRFRCSSIGFPSWRSSVGSPASTLRRNGRFSPYRATMTFAVVSVVAAMIPPSSELSPPFIAFCTEFAITRMTTRSNGVS